VEAMIALEVKNLSYNYEDGTSALQNVNFSLSEGERVGLVGANGAGKSTLLLHLNGLLPESPAEIPAVRVFDLPTVEKNLYRIRAEVGLLFQDPDDQLFCPTVEEDIAFGPAQFGLSREEIRARVTNALRMVGLPGFEKRTPHRLSQGEKRRICLAGVLAGNAKILVLDEPTSDLDPRSRRELKNVLLKLPATQLIASHDLEFVVEVCPRVMVMDRGRITASGPTTELLSNEALMEACGLEKPHILRHVHPH
jgi:cobalt/nickel transport system ATP-binding protein